jgi:hypothetical protein
MPTARAARFYCFVPPEGLTPTEVAHHIGPQGHAEPSKGRKREEVVEILEAIVLSIVAVATAWSGYQTARWDGRQAHLYGISSKDRAKSTQASTLGGQQRLYDSSMVSSWLAAYTAGNLKLAKIYERRFRPELLPAFRAWLATDPLTNPKSPPGPLFMPQYHVAANARAATFDRHASEAFETGTAARETGDKYLRNTVLLATVLFLTALAMRFKVFGVRVALVCVSAGLLGLALYFVFTYPQA